MTKDKLRGLLDRKFGLDWFIATLELIRLGDREIEESSGQIEHCGFIRPK